MPASASGSSPPVSTSRTFRPSISVVAATRSRVTPGRSSTSARLERRSRLKSVDFPTFARPTMATIGGPSLPPFFTSEPLPAVRRSEWLTLLAVLGEARRDSRSRESPGSFREGIGMSCGFRNISLRAVLLALVLASLGAGTATQARADAGQLCRGVSNLVLAPADMILGPVIAGKDEYYGM